MKLESGTAERIATVLRVNALALSNKAIRAFPSSPRQLELQADYRRADADHERFCIAAGVEFRRGPK